MSISHSLFTSSRRPKLAAAVLTAAVAAGTILGGGGAGAAIRHSAAPLVMVDSTYVSPTGSGASCTESAPCDTLQAALRVTADGGTVYAEDGTYPAQTVPGLAASQAPRSVTVAPAPGQNPIFGNTVIQRPGISFTDLTFHGALILRSGDNTINNLHIVAGTLLVRASNVVITNNLIEGGAAHDGINIGGYPNPVHNVVVHNNTVRDIGLSTGTQQHPDCLQLFDANHVSITQNHLYDCWNSGITFSPGSRLGINNILVESNFVQGCLSARQACANGGSSMDMRTHVTNVTIRNNTFGSGSLRMPYQAGIFAPNNIVGYLSVARPCTTSLSNSVIAAYPTWACKNGAPGATTTSDSGNRLGKPTYVDINNGDLHLAAPLNFTMNTTTVTSSNTDMDIDGQPLSPTTLGAAQTIGS